MPTAPSLADTWRSGRNNFNLMRLIAAWLVIYSHAWPITGAAGSDYVSRLTLSKSAGALAVDVFFVISGFLVAASLQRNTRREFLIARALRIYPALVVCILLTVLVLGPTLTTAANYWQDPATWRYLWANATLWRAEFWLPGVFESLPRTAVNGSLWTLPIEGRLYVALFLASVIGMLTPGRYFIGWALALAGACTYAWTYAPLPEHLVYLIWVTSFFITGTLLWVWRDRIRLSWWIMAALLITAAAARGSRAFEPAYFALVAYGTFFLGLRVRMPVIQRTDLSYGLYLYGWPMQQLALIAGATSVAANVAASTVLALICAGLSWFLIEKPALGWKRRLVRQRESMPAAAA